MAQIIIGVYEFVQIKFDRNWKGGCLYPPALIMRMCGWMAALDVNDTYLKSS
jgi:hypothetical protein